MSKKKRRRWTAKQKWQIIAEARQTENSVSEVCRRHGIGTGQFYTWEKKARQGALEALRANRRKGKQDAALSQMQVELDRMRKVVAELSAENLELKKGRWP